MSVVALALLGSASLAHGLAFAAPQPTTIEETLVRTVMGISPKPTQGPLELFKRDTAGDRTCGWYDDGTSSEVVTCGLGACMLYTSSGIQGMVGCCTSADLSIDYQNCGWANNCYDYVDYVAGKCDAACQANSFTSVCTDTDFPFCQSWTYPGPAIRGYGCGTDAASTWMTVNNKVADVLDGTATAQVPFVPATATITGLGGATGAATSGNSGKISTTSTTSASSSSSNSTVTTSISVAVIAIIIVAVLLSLCCVGGIIAWFCVRSKKNVAKFNAPSAATGAATNGQQTAPIMHNQQSNIVPPQGQYGQQSYFENTQNGPQGGAAADYYAGREQKTAAVSSVQPTPSPMSAPVTPATPAPPYAEPYQTYNAPPLPHMPPQHIPPAAQPYNGGMPMTQQYTGGAPTSQYSNNAVAELPSNPSSRPGGQIAELG